MSETQRDINALHMLGWNDAYSGAPPLNPGNPAYMVGYERGKGAGPAMWRRPGQVRGLTPGPVTITSPDPSRV